MPVDASKSAEISRKSTMSIPSNIAEGSERRGAKDKVKFLDIEKCGELATPLMLARDLGHINEQTANEMINELIEVSPSIGGLIRYCSTQIQHEDLEYRD